MTAESTFERRAYLHREATAILKAEYDRPIGLTEVARRLACSRRQLQRSFAQCGETTFRQTLASLRMSRARELLTETDRPVRDVARAVGYRQPAQFAKAFRRHFGAAPSEARALSGRDADPGSG